MGITAELHARRMRIKKPPTYPPMQLTAALPDSATTNEKHREIIWASVGLARGVRSRKFN